MSNFWLVSTQFSDSTPKTTSNKVVLKFPIESVIKSI